MASKTSTRRTLYGTQKRPRPALFKPVVQVLLIVVTAGVALAQGNTTEIPTPSPTNVTAPSFRPSSIPSAAPPESSLPSQRPSALPSYNPSAEPSTSSSPSSIPSAGPTESIFPSQIPSVSGGPSSRPSNNPSAEPSTSSPPSSIPSAAPTTLSPSSSPSLMPSTSVEPSLLPSTTPTLRPSSSPSASPSDSLQPSSNPTESQMPTLSSVPSISLVPSNSAIPSISPSSIPSGFPSIVPSLSGAPSTTPSTSPSFQPTLSQQPSEKPSVSFAPSTSKMPSSTPSLMPSIILSTSPSSAPTTSFPTIAPSIPPSSLPSVQPTSYPSSLPSFSPTLTKIVVSEEEVVMVLKGFTETLAPLEILKWEGITNKQIVTYYDDLNESLPGISHITVFMSRIKLIKQRLVDNPEVAGRRNLQGDEYPVLLELEYRQTITYGLLFEKEEEVTTEQLFVEPIVNDLQEYLVALIIVLDLEGLIYLEGLTVGDPTAPSLPLPTSVPTLPPTNNPTDGERVTSTGTVLGISLAIVFLVIFIASLVLYRRYKYDTRYRPEQMMGHEQETREFDNTGQNVDWRNPYYPRPPGQHSDPNTPPRPQDNPDVGPSRTSSGTVFTDLTDSEYGRGQDNESDIGMGPALRLRTILQEPGGYGSSATPSSAPLSPVHIPSDDDVYQDLNDMGSSMDMEDMGMEMEDMDYMPGTPPAQHPLGLGDDDEGAPSLSGFDLQIQDLE